MHRQASVLGRHDYRVQNRLFQAIREGDIATVERMIEEHGVQGILEMTLPGSGEEVLQAAVNSGQEEMLEYLLSLEGAIDRLNSPLWNQDTLLHLATHCRHIQAGPIVQILLDKGANPDLPDRHNLCVLDKAVQENRPEIARVVITHGNNPEKTAQLAARGLEIAEKHGLENMMSAMHDLMESFDQYDPGFALYNAIISNNQKRVTELFFLQADPFAVRFGKKKMSALHAAARQSDVRVLSMLLGRIDRMGRVDAADLDGRTPLHYAAAKNNAENVDWLLFAGANPAKRDRGRQLPADLATSHEVTGLLRTSYDKIPDAIVLMYGAWCHELPRTFCTLSRSRTQAPDSVIPPVLLFRCATADYDRAYKEAFESVLFEAEETCVELYEYRCSQPCAVFVMIDVSRYSYCRTDTCFLFKCTDDLGKLVHTVELTISTDQEGKCDVKLQKSGMLILMRRRTHHVITAPVGQGSRVITDDKLRGFELEVPAHTFQKEQKIMIKASEPPQLPQPQLQPQLQKENTNATKRKTTKVRDSPPVDDVIYPITNLSCFYTIKNTGDERPHKSLTMKIPFETKNDNTVVTLVKSLKHKPKDMAETDAEAIDFQVDQDGTGPAVDEDDDYEDDFETYDGDSDDASEQAVTQAGADRSRRYTVSYHPVAGGGHKEMEEGVWTVVNPVSVGRSGVSATIQDVGVVVAAQIQAGVKEADIIRAVEAVHSRQMQILVFAMAKPYPGNHVEVMLCSVSEELYEVTKKDQERQGFKLLREPIVAYAYNREVFSLHLHGNFTSMYSQAQPILEYQVGGRLNYATFVLQPKSPKMAAVGAIEVKRVTTQNSVYSTVGHVQLELTQFFKTKKPVVSRMTSRPTREKTFVGAKTEEVVMALSDKLSTDMMKIYCHALGLTREVMTTVCRPRKGKSLSPSEKNFRMLSQTRSQYRSEKAFHDHLKDVLTKHKEEKLLRVMDSILNPKTTTRKSRQ